MGQDETWHAGRPRPWLHCVRQVPSSPSPKGAQPPNFRPIFVIAKWLYGSSCHLVWRRPRPRRLCVEWGPSSPPQKGGWSPQFSAHVWCGQTTGWTKMPIGMQVGLGPGDFVLVGDPAPPAQKGDRAPQFLNHVYCGQTAGWTKMALGTEVGLGPGHIVLDGDPAPLPPKKGHSPTIFSPCLLWPNGCMHQDTTWYGGRPQPRRHCVRWEPSSPSLKGAQPPIFGPCLLWPNGWMDEDATW